MTTFKHKDGSIDLHYRLVRCERNHIHPLSGEPSTMMLVKLSGGKRIRIYLEDGLTHSEIFDRFSDLMAHVFDNLL